MKSNVTSNIIATIAIVLSIIAILFSITSLSNKTLQADWASVLVGVLGAMATILIGWQLFNVISFEKRIDSVERKIKEEIREDIEEVKQQSDFFTTRLAARSRGLDYFDNKKYVDAFDYLSVCFGLKSEYTRIEVNKSYFDIELTYLLKIIDNIKDSDLEEDLYLRLKNDISIIIEALYSLGCQDASRVADFLTDVESNGKKRFGDLPNLSLSNSK